MMDKGILFVSVFGILFVYQTKDVCSSTTPPSTNTTSTTSTAANTTTTTTTITTTISISTTTATPNTTTLAGGSTLEQSDNLTPMIIGVAVGVSVVVVATVVTALAFACFKHKKVHPSDTDTIYSDSISESDYESRPTTASHIFIDSSEEVPSRPVTMTPFELRKLFVETFPFENWKPGFDGRLKPRMPLKFVHPSRYSRTKSEEHQFRRCIYQFERSENLTISRPPSSTRMSASYIMNHSHTLEPVQERMYQNRDSEHTEENSDMFNFEQNDDIQTPEQNESFSYLDNTDHSLGNKKLFGESRLSEVEEASNSEQQDSETKFMSDAQNNSSAAGSKQSEKTNHSTSGGEPVITENGGYNEPNEGDIDIEHYDDTMTTEL